MEYSLFTDESLGGVMREYIEVKRKALVGELVKVTEVASGIFYKVGAIGKVRQVNDNMIRADGEIDAFVGHTGSDKNRYAVLEPSDIIHLDNERFRMVDRKAAVGERVIVTDLVKGEGSCGGVFFRVGNLAKCRGGDSFDFKGNDYVNGNGIWDMGRACYRALEPLTSAPSVEVPSAPLSSRPAAEQSEEIIAALTSEVESLKKRVAALEKPSTKGEQVGEAIRKILDKVDVVKTSPSPQQIRDEIVERAKADVAHLIDEDGFAYRRRSAFNTVVIEEFVTNREKRTVVVLGFEAFGNRKKRALGIAKCAPNDVFNAHIGRAIALRRALGLEVPVEYLAVPGPTEVRVGACGISDEAA